QCQRCGNCCRWPGEVVLTEEDLQSLARFKEQSLYDFVAEYTALRENRTGLTLVEKENGECIFLEGIECTVNAAKPSQCRGFPNEWNFPGWQDSCEAVPVPFDSFKRSIARKSEIR
ncbi:MAG: YkgJ family cysteine cluster protein, partial [Verrucomicrobiota bacterium]